MKQRSRCDLVLGGFSCLGYLPMKMPKYPLYALLIGLGVTVMALLVVLDTIRIAAR